MPKNETVIRIPDVVCIRATDAAMLCFIDEDEHWIPKSQVDDDSEVFDDDDNSTGTLVISEWIAKKKGLENAGEQDDRGGDPGDLFGGDDFKF